MLRSKFFALIVGGSLLTGASLAEELTLDSVPPVVVKTVPEAGAGEVDAGTTEIRVAFSKEMRTDSWSWGIATRETFPETDGKAKYDPDRRTCVLPVKLQSGKTYAVWINGQNLHAFKDAKGQSAVPYLLVFKTKG